MTPHKFGEGPHLIPHTIENEVPHLIPHRIKNEGPHPHISFFLTSLLTFDYQIQKLTLHAFFIAFLCINIFHNFAAESLLCAKLPKFEIFFKKDQKFSLNYLKKKFS